MSEQKFKAAKKDFAFSQQLVDQMRQSQMPQQDRGQMQDMQQLPQEAPQTAPQTPPAAPQTSQEPQNEESMLSSFMNEIRGLFKRQEDDEKKTQEMLSSIKETPKEAVLKVHGTMEPNSK